MIEYKARPRSSNHAPAPFDRFNAVSSEQLALLMPQKVRGTANSCNHVSISEDFNTDCLSHNHFLQSAKLLANRCLLYCTLKNIKPCKTTLRRHQLFYSYLYEFSNRFNSRTKDRYETFLNYFNQS
jgi:hypothetical protein